MHGPNNLRQGFNRELSEENLLFAEDFTSNALLQARVYWTGTAVGKVHEKPFLILLSAAPQAPAGNAGAKTYLLERPYGISMKFSVDELAALGFALDRIASGSADHLGIDNTWTKWADPSKAKNGSGGIGKKMLSVAPVPKNNDKTKRTVNLSFHCMLAADSTDPRGILKNCKRDGQGIKYGVTVNLGAYQAMAVAMNLLSLAEKLTDLDRQHRLNRFRANYGQSRRGSAAPGESDKSKSGANANLRLHQNAQTGARSADAPSGTAESRSATQGPGRSQGPAVNRSSGLRPTSVQASHVGPGNGQEKDADVPKGAPENRKPAVYGSRDSDFAPRPARLLAN
jgi:hypothetical protein